MEKSPTSNAHNNNISIFLVESSKGLLSLQNPPTHASNAIIVTLGPISDIKVIAPFEAHLFKCKTHSTKDINDCVREILPLINKSPINLVMTDDTFNVISYAIYKSLKKSNIQIKLILYDHLKWAGLTYRKSLKFRPFIKFRDVLLKYFIDFSPIIHSNGSIGYKLKLPFDEVIYFEGVKKYTPPIKIQNLKLVILVPLFDFGKYSLCMQILEGILERISKHATKNQINSMALKMHPRSTHEDARHLSQYDLINKLNILDAKTPLELFDLTNKMVLNFDSSFENCTNADVILLANFVGYSSLEASNMTGRVFGDLKQIENKILHTLNEN